MSEDKNLKPENKGKLNNQEEKYESIIEDFTNENQETLNNNELENEDVIKTNDVQDVNNNEVKSKKSNKNIKLIAISTLVGVLCLGVGFSMGKDAGRKLPATYKNYGSKVIATVGDIKITEKELNNRMQPLFYINAKQEMDSEQIKAFEQSMIDYMTTTEVLYLEGKKEKMEVTQEEIDAEYANLMASMSQQFSLNEEDFLKQFKMSKEYIRKDLEKELIAIKYMEKASEVSDKEAKNYYDRNKDEFLKVRASHILIQNNDAEGKPVSEEQKKKNKEKAEEILKKAQNGEDFAGLAKEYSEDGSSANGGDLDFFAKGQMVEPFEKAVFSLKVGDLSKDVVESQFGYHIIKKTDEKEEDFDTIKEELKTKLSYEKQNNAVDNLMEKYNVDIKTK